jgi:hypothetical protein
MKAKLAANSMESEVYYKLFNIIDKLLSSTLILNIGFFLLFYHITKRYAVVLVYSGIALTIAGTAA